MSQDSIENEDTFEDPVTVDKCPTVQKAEFRRERRATDGDYTTSSLRQSRIGSENDSYNVPSPLYYQAHSPCSLRRSRSSFNDSLGSLGSLNKYCSSLSIASHLSQQTSCKESIPDFVIPSRKTPPRSTTMTATGELVHYIKQNSSSDYCEVIKEEIRKDQLTRSLEVSADGSVASLGSSKSIENIGTFPDDAF